MRDAGGATHHLLQHARPMTTGVVGQGSSRVLSGEAVLEMSPARAASLFVQVRCHAVWTTSPTLHSLNCMPVTSDSRRGRRVFSYIRVSTAREEMISPELQQHTNERAAEREHLEIVEEVSDLDLSGRDFAKRKIQWMIDRIRAGEADGVLVYQTTRWGRNLEHSLRHLGELERAGGYLVSATEPIGELDTPYGRFNLHMLLLLAELQSNQIRDGWLKVHDRRRRLGLPHNSAPRFGYRFDAEQVKYVHDPITSAWLQRAYEHYAAGRPLSDLIRQMRDAGVKGTRGRPLTYSSLLFILDSGFGAGLIVKNAPRGRNSSESPEWFQGTQDPVISQDVWLLYQARRQESRAPRHVNPVSPFVALVFCASCGRRMYRCKDAADWMFACRNTELNSAKPCPKKVSIREYKIRDAVADWLLENIASIDALEGSYLDNQVQVDTVAEQRRLQQQLDSIQRRISNLAVMRADGEIDRLEYARLRDEAKAEESRLRLGLAQLANLDAPGVPAPPTPDALEAVLRVLGEGFAVDVANAALRKVVGSITVYAADVSPRVRIVGAWDTSSR